MPCATRARICVACVPNGPRAEERLPVRIITRVSRYHIDSIDTVSIVKKNRYYGIGHTDEDCTNGNCAPSRTSGTIVLILILLRRLRTNLRVSPHQATHYTAPPLTHKPQAEKRSAVGRVQHVSLEVPEPR